MSLTSITALDIRHILPETGAGMSAGRPFSLEPAAKLGPEGRLRRVPTRKPGKTAPKNLQAAPKDRKTPVVRRNPKLPNEPN
jgi:hypothetical protein